MCVKCKAGGQDSLYAALLQSDGFQAGQEFGVAEIRPGTDLMLCKESPRSLTKDIMASMMAMKPARACSLPCAVNTGRPGSTQQINVTLRESDIQVPELQSVPIMPREASECSQS